MGAIHATGFTEQMHRVMPAGFYLKDKSPIYDNTADKTEVEYTVFVKRSGTKLLSFRARPLPGCCGVLVVYYLRIEHGIKDPVRVFEAFVQLILTAGSRAKFGQLIFTQTSESAGERSLMKLSTRFCSLFTNWKTGNLINTILVPTAKPEEPIRKVTPSFGGE